MEVYDVANIDNKGFAERIISAPVSPAGQRFYVKTSGLLDRIAHYFGRRSGAPDESGKRRAPSFIHAVCFPACKADAQEGLILISVAATLLDGDPRNNFLRAPWPSIPTAH